MDLVNEKSLDFDGEEPNQFALFKYLQKRDLDVD